MEMRRSESVTSQSQFSVSKLLLRHASFIITASPRIMDSRAFEALPLARRPAPINPLWPLIWGVNSYVHTDIILSNRTQCTWPLLLLLLPLLPIFSLKISIILIKSCSIVVLCLPATFWTTCIFTAHSPGALHPFHALITLQSTTSFIYWKWRGFLWSLLWKNVMYHIIDRH
jgi:hypothetical protein